MTSPSVGGPQYRAPPDRTEPVLLLCVVVLMLLATLWEPVRTEHLPASADPPNGPQGSFQALHRPCGRLSVNDARPEELMVFPGIGHTVAERIVVHRRLHGDFESLEGMTKVRGIGAKTVDQLQAWLCAGCSEDAHCAPLGKIEPPGGAKDGVETDGI